MAKKRKHKPKKPKPVVRWWKTYQEYLNSRWWKARSQNARRGAKFRCESCHAKGYLVVHHRHYNTLGCEKRKDLEVLCVPCHEYRHESLIQANSHLASIARGNY